MTSRRCPNLHEGSTNGVLLVYRQSNSGEIYGTSDLPGAVWRQIPESIALIHAAGHVIGEVGRAAKQSAIFTRVLGSNRD